MEAFFGAVLEFFRQMFFYMVVATLLENTIFSRALGTSTSLFVVRKRYNLLIFGLVMTLIITASSVLTYLIRPLIQGWSSSYYLTPLCYVLVIGVVYILALLMTNRLVKKHKDDVLSMIHVTAFNCAVLGALLLASNIADVTFASFLGFGIGTGIGFTLATFFVRLAFERLSGEDVPPSFRGFPITLIYIGIVSLAIYGLIGHELPF